MTANLLPNGEQQFFDLGGEPLSGGLVYMYVPFTSTPSTTWVDQGQTTPNTNPIQLDAFGRCVIYTNPIILDSSGKAIIWGSGTYRQFVTDSSGNQIWDQLVSDGGLSDLQSQIDAILLHFTTITGQINTLNDEVSALQALGLQVDYVMNTGSYTLKASDVEIIPAS